MPTCYVTTPFGKKVHSGTGVTIDYDAVYLKAIKPAAERAGCTVIRADEDTSGGILHKTILRMAIASDVFIADLGDGNPNVMYELGVRHGARRGLAILVAPAGTRVPFNISYARVLTYEPDQEGQLGHTEVERLRALLQSIIELGLAEERNDSPVFEFFSGYRVELPDELQSANTRTRARPYPTELKQALGGTPKSAKLKQEAARTAEEIVRTTSFDDAPSAIEVLKKYRELAAWDDLIRFADELPSPTREVVQIQQMLALALNRRNQPGDRDRAVAMMERVVEKTGGDGETHGILGRIYKDRFALTGNVEDIQKATAHYRAGFEKEPSDIYAGANFVNLLVMHGGEQGRQELATVLPRVRAAAASRIEPERSDFWDLATALELAAIARDWGEARTYASRVASQSFEPWQMAATKTNLERLESTMDGADLQSLQDIERLLGAMTAAAEARNA